MSYTLFFNLHLVSRISEFGPVLFWSGLFFKGKLPVQSLVPSLSLNKLTPLTIVFSSICLSPSIKLYPSGLIKKQYPSGLAKIGPLRIGKIGPLRIGKIETRPDWDPSELANARPPGLGPLRFCENKIPPDWEPSGFVKIAFLKLP